MRYVALLLTLVCAFTASTQPQLDDEAHDRQCAQKDCRYSRLQWFTDFDAAKAEAQRTHKSIISLRLLGRLDEEVSCANSRFFRTILYPDPSIAPLMREHFVLHWQSVRSVPKVTIDLGDGRVIRQTITGNSVHYLLDENGRVLDALPGMVSPAAFRAQLKQWMGLNASTDLKAYHGRALTKLIETRTRRIPVMPYLGESKARDAKEAARRAMTKSLVEMPMLARLDPKASLRDLSQATWDAIGESEKTKVVFSEPALALMATKQELSDELLDQLRAGIAADTVLNQEELHYRIHEWFTRGQVSDLDALNQRVYAELFLTPLDDPWMGLKPPTAFAALQE